MALDVEGLWDFADPTESERRFREALAGAEGDDALILKTQIARTLGLRGRHDEAHATLDAVELELASAPPEVHVRYQLERGRTLRSSGTPAGAKKCFEAAVRLATEHRLEFLAGDGLHMVALVQDSPEGQLEWSRATADYARAAHDENARRWEATALHNAGVALNELGRHGEALVAFQEALARFEAAGRPADVQTGRWMVANTMRRLSRLDEALQMQLALERDLDAAGETDPYVYEELAELFTALGDETKARHYRARCAETD